MLEVYQTKQSRQAQPCIYMDCREPVSLDVSDCNLVELWLELEVCVT